MKFARTSWSKGKTFVLARSPQRMAAARRKVEKEKGCSDLFPELVPRGVRFNTAEERVDACEKGLKTWHNEHRAHRASEWRKARKRMQELRPLTRQGLLKYWNSPNTSLPREGTYLLDCIRDIQARHACPWRWMRTLRQLQLMGQGRLPRSTYLAVRAWDGRNFQPYASIRLNKRLDQLRAKANYENQTSLHRDSSLAARQPG